MLLKIYFILNTIQFYDSLAIYCVQLDVVFPHLEINGNGCSCIEFDTRQPKSIYTFNTKAIWGDNDFFEMSIAVVSFFSLTSGNSSSPKK